MAKLNQKRHPDRKNGLDAFLGAVVGMERYVRYVYGQPGPKGETVARLSNCCFAVKRCCFKAQERLPRKILRRLLYPPVRLQLPGWPRLYSLLWQRQFLPAVCQILLQSFPALWTCRARVRLRRLMSIVAALPRSTPQFER